MLFSEFLIEKIVIDDIIHQKIDRAVDQWISYISSKLPDFSGIRFPNDQKTQWVTEHHKELEEQLRRYLANLVQQLVKQTKPPIDDPDYEGHKIRVEVSIDNYRSEHGAIYSNWSKQYTNRPKYIYRNYLQLNILPHEVLYFLTNPDSTHELKAIITHELVHIIQSLKNPAFRTYTKKYYTNKSTPSSDERYYLDKVEIDAYAQGTASKILLKSKQQLNPSKFIDSMIQLLKVGMVSMFGRPIVPNQDYERIRNIFKEPSKDPVIQRAKVKAWKRYNKKLIEKLMEYK